jgi:PAS domain S-box-containing protein
VKGRLSNALALVTGWLPRGNNLPYSRWLSRHRAMVWVIWLHVPALSTVGAVAGYGFLHVLADIAPIAFGATVATMPDFSRRTRTLAAVVSLVTCSAVLVHLTGGLIESHFHFFAVVAFVTLYQEWMPFAVCLAYVVVHHGLVGVVAPGAVFNHGDAVEHPVRWAAIHGLFVILASLASLASWRLTDVERENVERVLAAAGDGIYGVDPSGRITFVNPMLCDLVGTDSASLLGTDHHVSLGHRPAGSAPDPTGCALCGAARRKEQLDSGELHLSSGGDGPVVPVEYVIRHVQNGAYGEGNVITIRDLRERQALEAKRRLVEAQRDQLASIAEASPDVALIGRSDGQFVWINHAGRRLLGFDEADDITAYRIEDMFSEEEMARVYAEVMPALARDGDWQGEWIVQARDKTQIPVWVTHHMHPAESAEHRYVSGTMRDLRRQRAEERDRLAAAEALRESEERARSVISTAGDAYVQFDAAGRITEWNAQAEQTFGLRRDQVLGRALPYLVLAAQDRDSFERRVGLRGDPDVEASTYQRFETTMLHRSAREFPVEVTSWAIETGENPVFGCFVRDISERQAVERAKNEFVSVVSHELRTPLTSIHGTLSLLRAGLLGELSNRGQQVVDSAVHNTDRLVRLINDILDIERLTSGRVALQRQQCDSAALATRSIDAMRPMAEAAGVRLEVDAQPGCVWADPDRVEQTFTNLLSNAIKFSDPGGTVRLVAGTTGNELRVEVHDQGRGIPDEHLELIFDRFQQVDSSDAREMGGTGLGLAICRTIVDQHGGRIWAESEPGVGTTMTITLPVLPADAIAIDREPSVLDGDDPAFRETVDALLRGQGYDAAV